MPVVVAHKWAPNPQEVAVAPDGSLDLSRAKPAISEYDPVAIELARGLADALGTELVGVSVGGPEAGSSMARKAALSRGIDRLVLVCDPTLEGAGATTTAAALAAAVAAVGDVTVVVTGDCSVDEGAHLVPAVLAGYLGWPALAEVGEVRPDGDALVVDRGLGAGTQVVRVTGPVVLAAASDAAVPRVPGMKDILGAGKKPVAEVPAPSALPGASLRTIARTRPRTPARTGTVIEAADPDAAAQQLVAALRADGRL